MPQDLIFVDRRTGRDRRLDADPCKNLPLDLYHRMRRKNGDRRNPQRSLSDDYYAYLASVAIKGDKTANSQSGNA